MNRRLIATLLVMLFLGSVGTNDILEDNIKPSNTLMNNSRYVDILDDWNWSTVLVNENGVSADDIAIDSLGNIYIVGTIDGQPNNTSVFDTEIKQGRMFLLQNIQIKGLLWLTQAGGMEPMLAWNHCSRDHESTGSIFVTGHFQLSSFDENQQL